MSPRHDQQYPQLRILYIDAYDSFTNNIVGLLERSTNVLVTVTKIDDAEITRDLESYLSSFTAVVVGPGPGDPRNQKDVGVINQLWKLQDSNLLPVLGICLGFQSLALAFGAKIERLQQPRHGLVYTVSHCGVDIFESVKPDFEATQYHSLRVNLDHSSRIEDLKLWDARESCPHLIPLAWDFSDDHNGAVLQALRHDTKPFWGLQYHPESVCTDEAGAVVVSGWWKNALRWHLLRGSIYANQDNYRVKNELRHLKREGPVASLPHTCLLKENAFKSMAKLAIPLRPQFQSGPLQSVNFAAGQSTVLRLFERLKLQEQEVILLDSQQTKGRFSIIGLVDPQQTLKLAFTVESHRLTYSVGTRQLAKVYLSDTSEIWSLLHEILQLHKTPRTVDTPSPFCGGLMGYISYEAGLDTIALRSSIQDSLNKAPDMNFAIIQRSIVIDHANERVYAQSLLPDDGLWLDEIGSVISSLSQPMDVFKHSPTATAPSPKRSNELSTPPSPFQSSVLQYFQSGTINQPSEENYRRKVLQCQDYLHAGDSYELCLTELTTVTLPKNDLLDQPWTLYKDLRRRNPAPFGAYVRLGGSTILSSSPERFLSWDRYGKCQMRPIKGTVRKSKDMIYDLAKAILNISKERAENLMIVDLVRHDLSGVVGAQNCMVSKLMQVEEYETVYQLVTVIEGQLPPSIPQIDNRGYDCIDEYEHHTPKPEKLNASASPSGIDILHAALPPGSMTGAPKKRSCELLHEIEDQKPRGIYSGVLGYMDVRGGGDFSVVIRTAFRWDDEVVWKKKASLGKNSQPNGTRVFHKDRSDITTAESMPLNELQDSDEDTLIPHQVWRLGAGGAVTVQSTDLAEFEEMQTKLDSFIKIFQPAEDADASFNA